MSKQSFNYKGYTGSIGFSIEDSVLFGKIEFINDLVSYEGNDLTELEAAFKEAVDDYLEMCEEIGKAPEKTMSGTFNVRVGEVLHKQLAKFAYKEDKSINDVVKVALEDYLERDMERQVLERVSDGLEMHKQLLNNLKLDYTIQESLTKYDIYRLEAKKSSDENRNKTNVITVDTWKSDPSNNPELLVQ